MSLIDAFMKEYSDSYMAYEQVRRVTENLVDHSLRDAGIMAITSSRVKDTVRLKEKLLMRNEKKHYASLSDIENDIVDFIGVRVALYFPNDSKKVDAVLRRIFDVEKVKVFPDEQRQNDVYSRRFSGYCATHYRVFLKESQRVKFSLKRIRIEIQVASLLMHAWSEVEHDLTYKQKKGFVSYDEYESLDEINGLVLAGEIALQRLQRLSELRISSESKPFSNHYLLASYIYDRVSPQLDDELVLGDVETLFYVLKAKNRLTPQKVNHELEKINYDDDTPIAQQIIDRYADNSLKVSQLVLQVKGQKSFERAPDPANQKAIHAFLRSWTVLEKAIDAAVHRARPTYHGSSMQQLCEILKGEKLLSDDSLSRYRSLRKLRNQVLHNSECPSQDDLQTGISELKLLTLEIQEP